MKKTLNIVGKVFKILAGVFIAIIVLVILVQRIFDNNLSLGGFRIYTIATGSMKPTYDVGDIIISKSKNEKDIQVGDAIVYLGKEADFKDKIVTHRVIDKYEESGKYFFETQGDNNTGVDPIVEGSQIYGVVLHKSLVLSLISKSVNSNIGFFLLILIPGAVLVFLEILDKVNEKTEKEEMAEENPTE